MNDYTRKTFITMKHEIFDRDVRGEMVSPNDPGYDLLITDIFDTMKTATEMNTGYHTPEEMFTVHS